MSRLISFKNTVWIAAVIGLLLATTNVQARRVKPLQDPPKASWGCELTKKQVTKEITAGMISLNWTPQSQKDGTVFGVLVVREKHTLRVRVKFDTTSFDINYVSSVNLKYKEVNGVKKIHPYANDWMRNLSNTILVNLQPECE
jgi:hypothetical protein